MSSEYSTGSWLISYPTPRSMKGWPKPCWGFILKIAHFHFWHLLLDCKFYFCLRKYCFPAFIHISSLNSFLLLTEELGPKLTRSHPQQTDEHMAVETPKLGTKDLGASLSCLMPWVTFFPHLQKHTKSACSACFCRREEQYNRQNKTNQNCAGKLGTLSVCVHNG